MDAVELVKLTVVKLRALCKQEGVPTSGRKAEIVERLAAHFANIKSQGSGGDDADTADSNTSPAAVADSKPPTPRTKCPPPVVSPSPSPSPPPPAAPATAKEDAAPDTMPSSSPTTDTGAAAAPAPAPTPAPAAPTKRRRLVRPGEAYTPVAAPGDAGAGAGAGAGAKVGASAGGDGVEPSSKPAPPAATTSPGVTADLVDQLTAEVGATSRGDSGDDGSHATGSGAHVPPASPAADTVQQRSSPSPAGADSPVADAPAAAAASGADAAEPPATQSKRAPIILGRSRAARAKMAELERQGKATPLVITAPKHPEESGEPTCSVRITGLVRPYSLVDLKELLSTTGTLVPGGVWFDEFRTTCVATFKTVEDAAATKAALAGVVWPSYADTVLHTAFSNQTAAECKDAAPIVATPRAPASPAPTSRALGIASLFKATIAKPVLYYAPVSDAVVAARRRAADGNRDRDGRLVVPRQHRGGRRGDGTTGPGAGAGAGYGGRARGRGRGRQGRR